MSKAPRAARSFETIEREDLLRLAALAEARLALAFETHHEKRGTYARGRLALCLCQGAADHFVDPASSPGVHDFDVWAFYRRPPGAKPLWNRKPFAVDFGPSKFGRCPLDVTKYAGRRVDVLWRDVPAGDDPIAAVRAYFEAPRTASARALREKPVVLIWPTARAGEILWRGVV
jgi:hypothetical protein